MTGVAYPTDIFARVLWGEARGEKLLGIQAVAAVVMNRCVVAKTFIEKHGKPHPLFGDGTPGSCVVVRWQFSCLNENDPNRDKLLTVTDADPWFVVCTSVAANATSGMLQDPTEGALYYKTTSLPWPASWGPIVAPVAVIGNQSFYDLP